MTVAADKQAKICADEPAAAERKHSDRILPALGPGPTADCRPFLTPLPRVVAEDSLSTIQKDVKNIYQLLYHSFQPRTNIDSFSAPW